MKKSFKYILPFILLTACVDHLKDYNVDQKRASSVPGTTLFSNALKGLTDILTTPNVNSNNYRMFVQYWATTTYLDEPRYSMTSRTYSAAVWIALYRDALSDLKEANRLISGDALLNPDVKNNQLAIIGIIEVYCWDVLVKTFGSVPYTQALDPSNSLPKYDDAETIYNDLLARLDASIAMMNPSASSLGSADLIYSGSVPLWIKFANSLKIKMGMLLADKNPTMAKTLVEQAAASPGGLIGSLGENARFPYVNSQPNNNPISANLYGDITKRQDFVPADKIVNTMNNLQDPRRQFYFTKLDTGYVGGVYGFSNSYAKYSHFSDKFTAHNLEGILMEYSEIEFYLAEAGERGFNVPGTPEIHYNNAIKASIMYWGGTDAMATTYLSQPSVAYTTASGDFKEKIGTQKWIAMFNRGWEEWVEWRRLDYPVLTPPLPNLKIPVRMIYPVSEQTLNTGPWQEATNTFLGGTDTKDTKLFWDVL